MRWMQSAVLTCSRWAADHPRGAMAPAAALQASISCRATDIGSELNINMHERQQTSQLRPHCPAWATAPPAPAARVADVSPGKHSPGPSTNEDSYVEEQGPIQ